MKHVAASTAVLVVALAFGYEPGSPVVLEGATRTIGRAPSPPVAMGTATAPVGPRTARVEILVQPAAVLPGEFPRAVLRNTGQTALGYSDPFALERWTGKRWLQVNRRQAFRTPLLVLAPGARSGPQPIAVYVSRPVPLRLRPGLYRLTKQLDLAPGQPRPPYMDVRAVFRVLPDDDLG